MRNLGEILTAAACFAAGALAQQPTNPLFTPPSRDPFESPFYTAPGTRVLPNGSEVPPPVPEALLGPGEPLARDHVWAAADFFYGAARATRLPPMVTSSPVGTSLLDAGVLGRTTTTTVFGGNQLSELRPSLRAEAGGWFTECWGIDGSFLLMPQTSERFRGVTGPGGPILARPIISGATGTESAIPVGLVSAGSITAVTDTKAIGGDINLRHTLCRTEFGQWNAFAGYRYLQLRDQVQVATNQSLQTVAPGLGMVTFDDLIRTRNEFHGPQVGLASTHRLFDRLSFSTRMSLAMGVTLVDARLTGSTTTPVGVNNGGLLVVASNAGHYTHQHFSVIPAADAKFGYDLTDWLRLNVGYTFLYWSKVERAADQIDRTLFAPGRPAYRNDTTDYWVQGVLLGVEVRY